MTIRLSDYLFFTTESELALSFYAICALGAVTETLRYGETGIRCPSEELRGKVMHAAFAGPGVLFYPSDNHDAEPMLGSAHILMLEDCAETDGLFAQLAEGGCVTTSLAMKPWGDNYGKLTDRFGVQWMLNCSTQTGRMRLTICGRSRL